MLYLQDGGFVFSEFLDCSITLTTLHVTAYFLWIHFAIEKVQPELILYSLVRQSVNSLIFMSSFILC